MHVQANPHLSRQGLFNLLLISLSQNSCNSILCQLVIIHKICSNSNSVSLCMSFVSLIRAVLLESSKRRWSSLKFHFRPRITCFPHLNFCGLLQRAIFMSDLYPSFLMMWLLHAVIPSFYSSSSSSSHPKLKSTA